MFARIKAFIIIVTNISYNLTFANIIYMYYANITILTWQIVSVRLEIMLEAANITKNFIPPISFSRLARLDFGRSPAVRALDNVSFSLPEGSVLAILGPNGAGKTTLLKILSTLIVPDSGTATVNGFRLGKEDDMIKGSIGLVTSSERGFYPRLTGKQNLEFFAALYGLYGGRSGSRIKELCRLFGIDYENRRFDSYSTGMQQNYALMRALLSDPKLLLLDEPTKSLDYTAALGLRTFIKERLVKEQKKAVVFTTHHMDEALDFADLFLILNKGKVYAFGTLDQLRKKAEDPTATLGEIFVRLTGRP
jgi:ABC-2 type transport system ATP-binding protein